MIIEYVNAVRVRYSNDFYIPTKRKAQKYLDQARKIKGFIFKKLNIKDSAVNSIIAIK